MSKIHTIRFENFKAIEQLEVNFNGCTAIITAGNDKGKTSFLKGMIDRIRFIRPDKKVREGATEGHGELKLDSGERFKWEFDEEGKDRLIYWDAEGIKQTVTVDLGKRFFPPVLDIDKFLQSPPKEQTKQLQKIVGLDFTEIDERYKKAYEYRKSKNEDAEKFHVKLTKMLQMPKVDFVDLTELQARKEAERKRLNELYLSNKKHNDELRAKWEAEKARISKEVQEHNEQQAKNRVTFNACYDAKLFLEKQGFKSPDLDNFLKEKDAAVLPLKNADELYPKEPTYITELPSDEILQKIDAEILTASQINTEAQKYQDYINYKHMVDGAKAEAEEADAEVKKIEAERKKMIESVTFPTGIDITPDGILVDGYPLDKNVISTSKLYTAALRIASMNLGEVQSLYFDASYLDKNTLKEIQDWAHARNLQLLIERPDFEDGDIQYHLIEN
jgi:hypothetical protein